MGDSIPQGEFGGNARYAVRRFIGAGALGLVYEGYDRTRGAPVALKTLRRFDPSNLYRLKQEFRSLADLSHPNLVTLFELVGTDGQWFIAMEMVRGVDFFRHVRGADAPGALSSGGWGGLAPTPGEPDEVSTVPDFEVRATPCEDLPRLERALVQLLAGVGALHDAGKLHRDIKPANVLVTREGRVVLVDFGLVYDSDRAPSELSRVEHALGTVGFLAPESVAGVAPTPASDLYSVGVLLFQGLTGRMPFQGTPLQVIQQLQEADPPRPSDLVDGVPARLDALCTALMSRDPAMRPSALDALVQLGEEPIGLAVEARARRSVRLEGREVERRFLEQAYGTCRNGRLVVAAVRGTAGIGKTSLLEAFHRGLRDRERAWVLRGRCFEREQVPYKALDSLMDGLRRRLKRLPEDELVALLPADAWRLARVFPVFTELVSDLEPTDRDALTSTPSELRLRALHALQALMRNLARVRPVVVILDDVQWGDVDSATLLVGWLKSLTRTRILVVLAWRIEDEDSSPLLQHLLRDAIWSRTEVRTLDLGPLSEVRAAGVARGLLGDAHPSPTEAAARIAKESGGHPHLLVELAMSLQATASRAPEDVERSVTLDELLQERLAQLEEPARRLLSVVAVSARPLPLRLLARAAGIDAEAARSWVARLRAHRLARTQEGPLGILVELYQSRVGEAVCAGVGPEGQARLHAALADAMEQEAWDDPEALMGHHLHAGAHARAAELASHAGRRAVEMLAFDQAAGFFQTAVNLGEWTAGEQRALREELAEALTCAGRGPQAADHYLELAEEAAPRVAADYRRRAAEQLLSSGHYDRGLGLLREVLATSGLKLPRSSFSALIGHLWLRLGLWWRGLAFTPHPESAVPRRALERIDTCWSSALALSLVDPVLGAWFHARNLRYSLDSGEPTRVLRALCMELTQQVARGRYDWDRRADLLARCRALAQEVDDPCGPALVQLGEGMCAYLEGRFVTAQRLLHQAERSLLQTPSATVHEVSIARLFALRAQLYGGGLRSLSSRYEAVASDAEARGDRLLTANLRGGAFAVLSLAMGDVAGVRSSLVWVERWRGRVPGALLSGVAMRGEVYLALYEGRTDEVWKAVERYWPEVSAGRVTASTALARVLLYETRGTAAIASGRLPEARRLARQLGRDAHRIAAPTRDLLLAGVALALGEKATAARHYASAQGGYGRCDMQLMSWVCRRRQGQVEGGEEALVRSADGWLANEGVVDTPRLCAALAPVPADVESASG